MVRNYKIILANRLSYWGKPNTLLVAFWVVLLIFCALLYLRDTTESQANGNKKDWDEHYESVKADLSKILYSNPSAAREFAVKIIDTLKSEHIMLEIEMLKQIGSTYVLEANFFEALVYYTDALTKAKENDAISLMGDINNNIGVVNRRIGNYKNALVHFTEAISHYDALGDSSSKASTLNNIGLLYRDLQNDEKALTYFTSALKSFTDIQDSIGMQSALNNLSLIYASSGKYDEAFSFLNQSILLCKLTNNRYGECIAYQQSGNFYLSLNDPEKAIKEYETSRFIAHEIKQPFQYAHSNLGIAKALNQQKKYHDAMLLAKSVMQIAEEKGMLTVKNETHFVLYEILQKIGDYKSSLEHYYTYVTGKEKLLNQSILHQVYDFELTNLSQANQLQQLELEKKELAIARKNSLLIFTLVVFFLTTGGFYLIYLNHRNRQRVKLQETVIHLTKKKSIATVEAEIQERKRIGHELHDCLGQMLSVIGLHISVLQKKKEMSEDKRKEILDSIMRIIDEAFLEVRNISHNLSPILLSERGLKEALKALSDQVNQSKQLKMRVETYGLNGKIDGLIENTLFRTIQEILNNAIKHSTADKLSVQVTCGENEITLIAEDNGKGFDLSKIKNSGGSGLSNIRSRIENLGGNIYLDSNFERGTIISIVIPLNTLHYA